MAKLKPARLVTSWQIIEDECKARGWVKWTDAALKVRAQTGTMTETDCQQVAESFGTSVALWRNLNASAAAWIAEHRSVVDVLAEVREDRLDSLTGRDD